MRRALAWTAGLIGIAALVRHLRGRPGPTPAEQAADPAEELRQTIAASREREGAPAEAAVAEAVDGESETSLEDRRAQVHAQAEETIAEMRRSDG